MHRPGGENREDLLFDPEGDRRCHSDAGYCCAPISNGKKAGSINLPRMSSEGGCRGAVFCARGVRVRDDRGGLGGLGIVEGGRGSGVGIDDASLRSSVSTPRLSASPGRGQPRGRCSLRAAPNRQDGPIATRRYACWSPAPSARCRAALPWKSRHSPTGRQYRTRSDRVGARARLFRSAESRERDTGASS